MKYVSRFQKKKEKKKRKQEGVVENTVFKSLKSEAELWGRGRGEGHSEQAESWLLSLLRRDLRFEYTQCLALD